MITGSTGVVAGVGSSAINDSIDGKTPTLESSTKAAGYALAGPGKTIGKYVGKVAEAMVKSEAGKGVVSQAASGITGAVTNAALDKQAKQTQEIRKKEDEIN